LTDLILKYVNALYHEKLLVQNTSVFLISFFACLLLTKINHFQLFSFNRSQLDLQAKQAAHTRLTPRIGGLAIIIALLILFILPGYQYYNNQILGIFYISLIPLFSAGVAEDLGMRIPPLGRLFSIILSALIVISLGKFWITITGVPIFDNILLIPIFAISFSVFSAAGAVNSFNLIDGVNGLSSFTAMVISISLSIIAIQANDFELGFFLLALFSIIAGFFILNFPLGKIFLGDAGAYALGHLLTWAAIYLMHVDNNISAFAILLLFFFPISDTIFAIWRRSNRGLEKFQPDRLHFHHLVMRFLEIRYFGQEKRDITNPLTSLIIFPFLILTQLLGLIFINSKYEAIISLIFIVVIYTSTYFWLLKLAQKYHKKPS
jgi:UDP-GlcNAc:undecaprenyl-phosphate GlcNAc-1-phosphate transferase